MERDAGRGPGGLLRVLGRAATLMVAVALLSAQQQPAGTEARKPPSGAAGLFADSVPGYRVPVVPPEAIARFRERAVESPEPREWFNLGAALLVTGDWQGALAPLLRVSEASPEEAADLEVPAAYDLGLAHAVAGRPVEEGQQEDRGTRAERREHLLQAREAFRRALRLDPGAEDARWNLELVERWLEAQPPPAGGGGGGGGGSGSAAESAAQPLSADQLERLLSAAAAEERRVQGERLQRNRSRDPVVEENW